MAELVVGLENNQKILIPTSSEARSGNPLGSFILVYGNTVPIGYLPLETLFDENQYPALYAMLGTNKTPDTPCDLGADWDKAESITVSTNISYTAQENGWIVGSIYIGGSRATGYVNGVAVCGGDAYQGRNDGAINVQIRVNKGDIFTCAPSSIYPSSSLSFVPFKKYAHVVIKATSGLEETQQDYVLQSLLEADSYSTEEVATGKKWIDGKMIYRKVCVVPSSFDTNGSNWVSTGVDRPSNIDFCTYVSLVSRPDGKMYNLDFDVAGGTKIRVSTLYSSNLTITENSIFVIEYTKAN